MSGALRVGAARAAQTLTTLCGASLLIWALLPLAGGDPAQRVLESQGVADPDPSEIAHMRAHLGLDRPLAEQYVDWLGGLFRGDLGLSFRTGTPVAAELAARLPATTLLAGASLLIAGALTLPLGVIAARFAGGWPDHLVRVVALTKASIPSFVLALLMLTYVVVGLGFGQAILSAGRVEQVWMPALIMGVSISATWSRVLRAGLLDVMAEPFALVMAARGSSRLRVLITHALPGTAAPMLNLAGLTLAALLTGAAITESIFSWPGVGKYAIDSIGARDLPAIQGFALLATLAYVVVNLTVDALVRLVDPRARGTT